MRIWGWRFFISWEVAGSRGGWAEWASPAAFKCGRSLRSCAAWPSLLPPEPFAAQRFCPGGLAPAAA